MSESLFNDKKATPSFELLENTLGLSFKVFESIIKYLNDNYSNISTEWKHYGKTIGWSLKVYMKKRNLFFITPKNGFFNISFVFGDKAVEAIKQDELPTEILNTILNAKKYVEGRGIKLEIFSLEDLPLIIKLLEIKLIN